MTTYGTVKLHNVEGIARLSGVEYHDGAVSHYIQFEVDYLAEQLPGECNICGLEIESGWVRFDGGEECCDEHVEIVSYAE